MEHFMTSEEIVEILHVDPVTVRRLVNKGELSAYRIGADYRFAPSDLQDYLWRQRIAAPAQNETDTSSSNLLAQFAHMLRTIIQGKYTTASDRVGRCDRFTDRVQHVLMLAQEEALRFQHRSIGTEHLLLGLVREREGVAAQVLSNLGIEVDQVRHAIEAIVGRGEESVLGEIGVHPRTKKVIELAVDEAHRLNHHYIGTEHLLLGLIREGEGVAAQVLKSLGLQLEQVRTETLGVLRKPQQKQEKAPVPAIPSVPSEAISFLAEGMISLTCTSCGAGCPGYFRYCFNCGQPLSQEEKLNHGEEQ